MTSSISRGHFRPETPRLLAVSNAAGSESVRSSDTMRFYCENTSTPDVEKSVVRKKRGSGYTAGGLRHFTSIVCSKLKSKGIATYKEVVYELIAEIPGLYGETESMSESDAKNIQRRVYDVLNVLLAIDIITIKKKHIHWKGLQDTDAIDWEGIKAQHVKLMGRVSANEAYLKDLKEQMEDLQNLVSRNRQLRKSGNCSRKGFSLPFILAQTSNNATVEIEISEDMHWCTATLIVPRSPCTTTWPFLRCRGAANCQTEEIVSQSSSVYSSLSSGMASLET